jgi:hypothetical protein
MICDVFGKSRQAFYAHEKCFRKDALDSDLVVSLVLGERRFQPRIGARKLHCRLGEAFRQHGVKVGRDRLFGVLREHGLLVGRRKRHAVTTNSRHWMKKYGNLIAGLAVDGPDRIWVSDITYVRLANGFCYLSLVTDLHSRKIVGWHCSGSLETEGSVKALEMALKGRKDSGTPLIHHSDRGVQYCSHEYTGLLKADGIAISMGEVGNPYENAVAERVNGILKDEFMLCETFGTLGAVRKHAAESIRTYNERRPHLSCGMMTPEQAYGQEGQLKREWKNYRKKAPLANVA